MRFLHTSDWHLGHSLHGHDRAAEHEAFLTWLLDQLEATAADALLIAGDVFDTANPSAAAQAAWYRFLAGCRRRFPALDLVVIGGNHDNAARLDAPAPILDALQVRIVGGARHHGQPRADDELIVPLHGADGEVAAWVAAVPFLRPADLPRIDVDEGQDPLIEGVRAVYRQVLDVARARRAPGHALIGMGHCYMSGTQLSEDSERRVLVGNQHALPADIFPDDVAYVALGHLHKAQRVGSDRVRYCGSPIPLSMSERTYQHQVLQVDLDGPALAGVRALPIPRSVDMLRVPSTAAAPLDQVVTALRELPEAPPDEPRERWPFLEVHVRLDQPEPALRRQVEAALEGRRARLVKLRPSYTGTGAGLADQLPARSLDELDPREVFVRAWERAYRDPPGDDVLARFDQIAAAAVQEQP